MPIIIDGHNLLHTIRKTNEELQSISDIQLCQVISKYLKLTGQKGEIVFDGTGPRDKSVFDNIINLEVLFAGQATDADGVIEHKIRLNTAPKRLKIVSSDRRLRKAAQTRKVRDFLEGFREAIEPEKDNQRTGRKASGTQ
jgi:predicted RNA-binding protein with PIN domain